MMKQRNKCNLKYTILKHKRNILSDIIHAWTHTYEIEEKKCAVVSQLF